MSNGPEERFNVTAEDLRRYDWLSVLDSCERRECVFYSLKLNQESRRYHDAGDDLAARVFGLLSAVASFHANYDAEGSPYHNAEYLTEHDLATLGGILNEIGDPEFRARVADVLWTTKKDFKAAKLAIASFIASAQRLKTGAMWPPFSERLERAARIAAIRGFDPEKAQVIEALETTIAEYSANLQSGLLSERLMGILMLLGAGDSGKYAAISEELAKKLSDKNNWHFAECYWERAELWHKRAKNPTEAQRCQIARAETYISRADAGLPGRDTNYMYSAHWMGKGLEALRAAKADSIRIQAINKRFLDLQKLSANEMSSFAVPVEKIPGFREEEKKAQAAAEEHVQGLDFPTAIARFALINRPTSWEEMKQQHAKTAESAPLMSIIGASAVDRTGKKTDFIPSHLPSEKGQDSEAARKQMVQQARMVNWPMKVTWSIAPARWAIHMEHGIRQRDLWFLVDDNPFIPPGHEGIYLRGIQAGFFGDWLTAMHLLIPQIEASLRHILQQNGVITSTMDGEGIQQERDLNQLLWMKESEEIFGQDILFDLRGILIERFGHNLRNELAHGLVPERGFYHAASEYLWWLIVHLCWRSFHFSRKQIGEVSPPEDRPGE